MLWNYLKICVRRLARNPFFTVINLLGLSLGFSAFMILWQHSESQLASEHFIPGHRDIVRVCINASWTDNKGTWQGSQWSLANAGIPARLANDYKEAGSFTRIFHQAEFSTEIEREHGKDVYITCTDEKGNKHSFVQHKMAYADPNAFDFFGLSMAKGSPHDALRLANAVVLSETKAKQLFGNSDPTGKTLLINDTVPLVVTGVFNDLPGNTHLDFDIVASTERIKTALSNVDSRPVWGGWGHCYLKLKPGTDIDRLSARINTQLKEFIRRSLWGDWAYGKTSLFFQKLDDAPFKSFQWDNYTVKSKYVLLVLKYSSLIILLMAWINYINLTLSANNKRMKELAVRKTSGARTSHFITQFATEALVINILSIVAAIIVIQSVRYPAERFFHFHIQNRNEWQVSNLAVIGFAVLAGILLTGVYPALISLKRSPKSLFGMFKTGKNPNLFGNYLTTFQFASAVILMIWMYVVFLQIRYILHKDIGLDKENVLVVDLPIKQSINIPETSKYFSNEVSRIPTVRGYAIGQSVPCDGEAEPIGMNKGVGDPGLVVVSNGGSDDKFIPFFAVDILAGRNFLNENMADRNTIILSLVTIHRLGFRKPADAIGQLLNVSGHDHVKIIGVINDYKLQPFLTQGIDQSYQGNPGLALTYGDYLAPKSKPRKIALKITSENITRTIASIEQLYMRVFPNQEFHAYFLDEMISSRYESFQVALNQIALFTTIAIIIACLGLLGTISGRIAEKTKEIGIRKILGAGFHHIIVVLLHTTLKQALMAILIGMPLAGYLANRFFESFSERIQLRWWHFTLPLLSLGCILLTAILFKLVQVIRANPTASLKCE